MKNHYSYYYYSQQVTDKISSSGSKEESKDDSWEPPVPANLSKATGLLPDILYSSSQDGEIVIEWSEQS